MPGQIAVRAPSNATELLRILDTCAVEGTWTAVDAANWWTDHSIMDQSIVAATIQFPLAPRTPAPDTTMAYQGDGKGTP